MADLAGPLGAPVSATHTLNANPQALRDYLRDQRAKYVRVQGTAAADAAGYAVVQLGPVPAGRRWIIHQISVGGITWGTVAAGSALAVVQAQAPSTDTAPPLINVLDEASPLPSVSFYSRGMFVVRQGCSLWLVISGATSGQSYAGACSMVDEAEAP